MPGRRGRRLGPARAPGAARPRPAPLPVSGPAAAPRNRLLATCLDIDLQALAFVADIRDKKRLKKVMTLENENLIYLATGRRSLEVPPQDLVYSIGLIHRDEADMDRLYAASAFGRPCARVLFEEQGINLFAECVKA